jgi:hypothetical protein
MKNLRPNKDFSFHANLDSILHWFRFSGTEVASVADSHLMALVREMLIQVPNKRPTAIDVETRLQLVDVFRSPSDDPLWGECCAPVSESSRQAQHLQVSSVFIRLGNTHQLSGRRHSWRFFIRAPAVQDLITEVHYFLV